jgi:hypothetical protein
MSTSAALSFAPAGLQLALAAWLQGPNHHVFPLLLSLLLLPRRHLTLLF